MIWVKGQALQSGKYHIIQQIGGGRFGLTYLAKDMRLQRQVVIKAPNLAFQRDQDYEPFIRRFQREGEVLAKISHPNVVRVIELFKEAGMPCLVMEYVEGETLNECIRRTGKLSEEEAVRYFRQLATALHTVHQFGLIHCDIHPSNIMLQPGAEPILIDFGSTKSLLPMTYTVTTTVNQNYTPYEQGNDEPKATLDVYGLAATLYFAVTGQKPQPAMHRKMYGDTLKPPKVHRPGLSKWLNQAILSGMALEAPKRTPSMQAWLGLLHPPQPKPKPQNPKPSTQPKKPEQPADNQSTQSFPWSGLCSLILGYFPIGIIVGLSNSPPLAWAWVGAGTLAGSGAGTLALAGSGAGALAGALTGAGALAGAGTLTGALALAWLGSWLGAWLGFEMDKWIGHGNRWLGGWILGSWLAGAIAGYFTGIGIWAGLGLGALALVQSPFMFGGMITAEKTLKQGNNPLRVFLILSMFSLLGLALGGGFGWWLKLSLKLSGVNLPT